MFSLVSLTPRPLFPKKQKIAQEAISAKTQPAVGSVRFTVLSPTLIRMEYSPSSQFVDAPTAVVVNRNWPQAASKVAVKNGWTETSTDKMTVRYKNGSGSFTPENLIVAYKNADGPQSWKPGDKDDRNLGGVVMHIQWLWLPEVNPGVLSANGYFVLDDSKTPSCNAKTNWLEPRIDEENQDWYFFAYGHDYKLALQEFAALAGQVPMVPKYVLGAMFTSRFGYTDRQWKDIATRFREENVPMDVLVLDSASSVNRIWGGYDWDPIQMPKPREFFKWMHEHGFKVSVNEHYAPMDKIDSTFEPLRKYMGLPEGITEIPHDLANQKYAKAFMEIVHKPWMSDGMDFWWMDGNAECNMKGLDAMMWSRHVEHTGSEKLTGKRTFVLCRNGGFGSHRYPGYFTGDAPTEWLNLAYEVKYNVQASNVLEAYITNDISGFTWPTLDPELYVRWVQFGCLSPIMRFHSIFGLRMPWEYGDEAGNIAIDFLKLRYKLLPFIYTYSRLTTDESIPMLRGMYIEYPDQQGAYDYRHQFMLGEELLVAPVTESARNHPKALKDVFLPAGQDWIDYFTGKLYEGGQVLSYDCPLDQMPIFVRAGSIIPMQPEMDYSDQKPLDPLALDIYAGKNASFRLYEDDGLTFDYKKGQFAWTPIKFEQTGKSDNYAITVGPREGTYKGALDKRRYIIRLNGLFKPEQIKIGTQMLAELKDEIGGTGWTWDKKSMVTTIYLSKPSSAKEAVTVSVVAAGTFADRLRYQKIVEFRNRIREIRHHAKLKFFALTSVTDIKGTPFVMCEADEVEYALNDMITKPKGLAKKSFNLKALADRMIAAFTNKPFGFSRTLPDPNPSHNDTVARVKDAAFEPGEIKRMTAIVYGLALPIKVRWDEERQFRFANGFESHLHIWTRLCYDPELTGEGDVSFEIQLPEDWPMGAAVADGAYSRYDIRHRNELRPEKEYHYNVKAVLKMKGGREAEIWRDYAWHK